MKRKFHARFLGGCGRVNRSHLPGSDMSLSLRITFSDSDRSRDVYHPFSFQAVLLRAWWPLAKRLNLPLLQQLECLDIRNRVDAEKLVDELEIVREALAHPEAVSISEGDAAYMLQRISDVVPLIRGAIRDWDDVVNISL